MTDQKEKVKCENCKGYNKCGDPSANEEGNCPNYMKVVDMSAEVLEATRKRLEELRVNMDLVRELEILYSSVCSDYPEWEWLQDDIWQALCKYKEAKFWMREANNCFDYSD